MKILVVGGGTGGHIVPAVTVAKSLLKINTDETLREKYAKKGILNAKLSEPIEVEFWTDWKNYDNVIKMTTIWNDTAKDTHRYEVENIEVKRICSGKFHRYNWKPIEYLANWQITLKDVIWGNVKGLCGFATGLLQSWWRLGLHGAWRPDVIFLKGGFVGLPVGLVAGYLKIPYVIHESDATLGLANRILAKKAQVVAMGWQRELAHDAIDNQAQVPEKNTTGKHPEQNTTRKRQGHRRKYIYTGIPVGQEFRPASESEKAQWRRELGFNRDLPVVIITGGSQGAVHLNTAVKQILPELLKVANIGLIAGKSHVGDFTELEREATGRGTGKFKAWGYSYEMKKLLGAADVVVSRAGATTIVELSVLGKAVILVPFEKLPGGHQLKNAKQLAEAGAVKMVVDADMMQEPERLLAVIQELAKNGTERRRMAERLHRLNQGDAAERLVEIILEVESLSK